MQEQDQGTDASVQPDNPARRRIFQAAAAVGAAATLPGMTSATAAPAMPNGPVRNTSSEREKLCSCSIRSVKMMKITSGTGKVTVFNGNEKVEAPLALVGDRLEAKGAFKVAAGTKVLADVALNGKPAVAARFTLK